MELRKINKNDAKAQWEYTTALPTDENGLTNPYNGVSYNDYMNKVLPTLISYEHPVNIGLIETINDKSDDQEGVE